MPPEHGPGTGPDRPEPNGSLETRGSQNSGSSPWFQLVLVAAGVLFFAAGVGFAFSGSSFGLPMMDPGNATGTPTAAPEPSQTPTATGTESPAEGQTSSATATVTATTTATTTVTPTATPSATATETENGTIDAQIVGGHVDSDSYEEGERVRTQVTVRNTGNRENTFYVGYSVVGPTGTEYHNGGEHPLTGRAVELDPGESETLTLAWVVESEAPDGVYDTLVIVWQEDEIGELETQLGSARADDSFRVESE